MDSKTHSASRSRPPVGAMVVYTLMVAVTVAGFLLIRGLGETLTAPPPEAGEAVVASARGSEPSCGSSWRSPRSSSRGRCWPGCSRTWASRPSSARWSPESCSARRFWVRELSALVLPPSVAPYLGVIAQLGVVLYMFLVGLELNPALLKNRAHATVATSHASILVPVPRSGRCWRCSCTRGCPPATCAFTSFALFMGVAMSITAFPVLARILTDCGMTRTRSGSWP